MGRGTAFLRHLEKCTDLSFRTWHKLRDVAFPLSIAVSVVNVDNQQHTVSEGDWTGTSADAYT